MEATPQKTKGPIPFPLPHFLYSFFPFHDSVNTQKSKVKVFVQFSSPKFPKVSVY